jgi:hypothetical protein
MSGTTPSGDNDIIEGDEHAFIVGVPNSSQSEFTNYLRLGQASPTDEGFLQVDPSASGASPTLISSTGTAIVNSGTTISPFSSGELAYSTGTTQLVAPYSYIRMGAAATYEQWLPAIPSQPPSDTPTAFGPANASSSATYPTGVLIYSNQNVNLASPVISQSASEYTSFTGDNLSVVHDGKIAVSATYTTPGFPFTSTYQLLAAMNVTVGPVSNFLTPTALTYWLGNDASTGLGSLLWSNFGTTQNVFGGQIVNIINSSIDVQGLGESKLQDSYGLDVTTTLDLVVSPLVAGSEASTALLSAKYRTYLAMVAAAVQAAGVLGNVLETGITADVVSNASAMRKLMITGFAELSAMTAAVIIMQSLAVLAGLKSQAAAAAAKDGATAKISMMNGQITLTAGGTLLALSPFGFRVSTLPAGSIELASTTVDTNAAAIGFAAGI